MSQSQTLDAIAILDNLTQKLAKADLNSQSNVGKITTIGDNIALVSDLHDVGMGELVRINGTTSALALNLNSADTGCVILADNPDLKEGDLVETTGQLLSIPVADELIGRVVDPLGAPLDGKPALSSKKLYPLEKIAPRVMTRESVNQPLQTGIKAIDAMIPIGRGQRELIIGDKATGKTAIALTSIINQAKEGVICIYVAIGQKRAQVSQIIDTLTRHHAMNHTIVVAATASEPASLQFIAPYAGTAIGEYFLDQGKDVLIVYDDLTKHAWSYREISLLLRRPSGREAYPGDVFYLHSRLLERACKLNPDHGGGSITALPIIETQANDVSAYIPTNVISITDGQIYLEADLFNSGQRPAVNVGLSVSRVGSAAQIKAMKQAAGKLRLELAQFRSLEAFTQFSSDLDPQTKAQIDRGARLTQILKQHWEDPKTVTQQAVAIWAATNGFLDKILLNQVSAWEAAFLEYLEENNSQLMTSITSEKILSDDNLTTLSAVATKFNQLHPEWMIPTEN